MPELPEVESVCRIMRTALAGKQITACEVVRDPIVFSGHGPRAIEKALVGRSVAAVGRRGKFWWLELGGPGPTVFGHLGMSGWIQALEGPEKRLHGHGKAPLRDAEGRPRFMRLLVRAADGEGFAFTDPRRFGRIWLGDSPETDPQVRRLGPDAYESLPSAPELLARFAKRRIAIKAALLDQSVVSGIGNWIADEVLYQARIAPARVAATLTKAEVSTLRRAITSVLAHAVAVDADYTRFPKTWLFAHRWGGTRGAETIGRQTIVREVVGGRTTAWVPSRQR